MSEEHKNKLLSSLYFRYFKINTELDCTTMSGDLMKMFDFLCKKYDFTYEINSNIEVKLEVFGAYDVCFKRVASTLSMAITDMLIMLQFEGDKPWNPPFFD